jgi:acyl-CoA thioester hydrolase
MSRKYVALIPIRFSDCDSFGHVNHASYLTYCEDHRTEMFTVMGEECGSWLLKSGFVVVSVSCNYLRFLTLSDRKVEVACSVQNLGESSLRLHYVISSAGNVVADISSTLVLTDGADPRPKTESERSWLSQFQDDANESTED